MSQDGGGKKWPDRSAYQKAYQRRMRAQLDALSEVMNAVEAGRSAKVECEGRTFVVGKSRGRMWLEIRGVRPPRGRYRRFF